MYKKISSGTTIPLLHLYHMLPNQTTNVFVSITEIEGDRNALCAFECVCKTALWVMISNGNISVCMNINRASIEVKCIITVKLLRNHKLPF